MDSESLKLLQRGGVIHKLVQQHTKDNLLKSGVLLWDLSQGIENKIKELTRYTPKKALYGGVAFPTGLSINNCSAHWTPNPGDDYQRLKNTDLIKVDFGVHLNGFILDGAFSYTENPELQPLIDCSVDATQTGINCSGVDAVLGDIGKNIQEVIESYEIEIGGKVYPVKSTFDLCGHQIEQYHIHAGKAVPNVFIKYPLRMRSGEQYAIETFPSTGTGRTREDKSNCSHYMINQHNKVPRSLRKVYEDIYAERHTLAFCKRWLPETYNQDDMKSFNRLVNKGYITAYPPLYDTVGSYVAQTEKTIYINNDEKVFVLN